jgi:hypothetical protein
MGLLGLTAWVEAAPRPDDYPFLPGPFLFRCVLNDAPLQRNKS